MFALFPSREIAISIGSLNIHWYGILYAVGFIVGLYVAKYLQRFSTIALSTKQWSTLFNYVFFGVILGGRLGYMLLYNLTEFVVNPLQLFAVWNGGMSSHGGFVGVAIALVLFARTQRILLLKLVDILVVPIAIGLALGRLGNFINLELYGSVTTLPWGIKIPGVEGLRHPTQLYAIGKNLLIAAVCAYTLLQTGKCKVAGFATGMLLLLYGILRFSIEYLRVPTHSTYTFLQIEWTRGQVFSIPLVVVGILVLSIQYRTHVQMSDGDTS